MLWQQEIIELHQFFEALYLGTEDSVARAEAVFHPDFTFAGPDGDVVDRDATLEMLRQGHGHTSSLTIATSDHQLHFQTEDAVVASYVERHDLTDGFNERLSTVIFAADPQAPNGVAWVRVHETWLRRPAG